MILNIYKRVSGFFLTLTLGGLLFMGSECPSDPDKPNVLSPIASLEMLAFEVNGAKHSFDVAASKVTYTKGSDEKKEVSIKTATLEGELETNDGTYIYKYVLNENNKDTLYVTLPQGVSIPTSLTIDEITFSDNATANVQNGSTLTDANGVYQVTITSEDQKITKSYVVSFKLKDVVQSIGFTIDGAKYTFDIGGGMIIYRPAGETSMPITINFDFFNAEYNSSVTVGSTENAYVYQYKKGEQEGSPDTLFIKIPSTLNLPAQIPSLDGIFAGPSSTTSSLVEGSELEELTGLNHITPPYKAYSFTTTIDGEQIGYVIVVEKKE